ncbi:MAG: hypothetical protein GXY79_08610 [Chloroflexi bacterium]|nr:hypothetical protein [Chloroflexota bacterium]
MKTRLLVLLLVAMLVASTGCFLTDLAGRFIPSGDSETEPLVNISVPSPDPTKAPATPQPTATAKPTAEAASQGQSFTVELTESDISELLAGFSFSREGFRVGDAKVVITPEHISVTLSVAHEESGVSGDITAIGVPQVVEGQLYLKVVSLTLGDSFTGFTRLIADALVKSALDRFNAGNGIPVEVEKIGAITQVELYDGRMVVTGARP